jgi:sugar phosphate isomerase/epimerase
MTHNRRDFLRAAGTSLGAAALVGPGSPLARWGTLLPAADPLAHARTRLEKIGVQLYTVRGLMQESVERTLSLVASAGYKEVEFAGYFGRTPAQVTDALRANGLAAPSAHIDLESLKPEKFGAVLDVASKVGHEYVILAWLAPPDRSSVAAASRIADLLLAAADKANAAGIKVGFHNHDGELQDIGGTTALDVMMQATAGSPVVFEMDLYWTTRAGHDPVDWFTRYPGRFHQVHVKDSRGGPQHEMVSVGEGTIDWARIFQARAQGGIRHFYVEHDEPKDALQSIRTSAAFLQSLDF